MSKIKIRSALFKTLLTLLFVNSWIITLSAQQEDAAANYFTNVVLVNQYGQQMRLYDDLLKDNVVLVNAFYTTDDGQSPAVMSTIKKIQEHFGASLTILSISSDPADRPARLNEYVNRFNGAEGWYLLTGEKVNVDFMLQKFGLYTDEKEDGPNTIMIGNVPTGLWKKAFGLAKAEEFIPIIDSAMNDDGN